MLNFFRNIGMGELIVIAIVVIVFFGSKKIVELGKAAGETTKEFKKIKKDFTDAKNEVQKDSDLDDDDEV